MGALAFAVFAAVTLLYSMVLPAIQRVLGMRKTYALAHLLAAAGLCLPLYRPAATVAGTMGLVVLTAVLNSTYQACASCDCGARRFTWVQPSCVAWMFRYVHRSLFPALSYSLPWTVPFAMLGMHIPAEETGLFIGILNVVQASVLLFVCFGGVGGWRLSRMRSCSCLELWDSPITRITPRCAPLDGG